MVERENNNCIRSEVEIKSAIQDFDYSVDKFHCPVQDPEQPTILIVAINRPLLFLF